MKAHTVHQIRSKIISTPISGALNIENKVFKNKNREIPFVTTQRIMNIWDKNWISFSLSAYHEKVELPVRRLKKSRLPIGHDRPLVGTGRSHRVVV